MNELHMADHLPAVGFPRKWDVFTVEVVGDGSLTEVVRSFVVPFWKRLSPYDATPGTVRMRLEQPNSADAPLLLHLDLAADARDQVDESLRKCATAAGRVDVRVGLSPSGVAAIGEVLGADAGIYSCWRYCLSRSTDVYLDAVSTTGEEGLAYGERQARVLELILAALPVALPELSERGSYIAYHRDWLIRYPVLQSGQGMTTARRLLALLQGQVEAAGAPTAVMLEDEEGRLVCDALRDSWLFSLQRLRECLAGREEDPLFQVDPFARGPLFPTLFRLFHAVARQFGLAVLDEAFLYHLLMRALHPERESDRLFLAPHLDRLPEPEAEAHARLASSFEEGYSWGELIGLSGDDGREWLSSYKEAERKVGRALEQALYLLREGRTEEGDALLREIASYRQEVRAGHPGIFHVLGRFYHGERAYYEYQTGDLASAGREMDEAAASVRRAIQTHRFLLPIAPLIVDIPLQKARIARRQRDWPAMELHLKTMLEMESGECPLCVLEDGTIVDYELLRGYFEAYTLEEPHRSAVAKLLDVQHRLREFRRLTTKLYVLPNLVVVAPPVAG